MSTRKTLAEVIAAAMKERGIGRLFGIPGGGSSLDLIDAADRAGIPFVLTHTETAAVIMAAVTGELSGVPGVALAGIGPGAAASVNGIAYAKREQAPVVLFTDCKHQDGSLHQAIDQPALFGAVTKDTIRLRPNGADLDIDGLFRVATTPPKGPVHVDLSAADAAAPVDDRAGSATDEPEPVNRGDADRARALLADCRTPVVIVGLEARSKAVADWLAKLVDSLGAAVMPTYKGKGIYPEDEPGFVGPFTGASADSDCVGKADLIVLFGVDPVEFIPGDWIYRAPILELSVADGYAQPANPAARLIGPLGGSVEALMPIEGSGGWSSDQLRSLRDGLTDRLSLAGSGHTAQTITSALRAVAPAGTRLTVDSGAHMLSVLTCWRANEPFGVLKSNGLSTMGFALPAAIASACHEPQRPVAAVTGDGGLMMVLGELATAARVDANIVVVIVNDAALSMIDIKQLRQQRPPRGVRYPSPDFVAAARALGCAGLKVGPQDDLRAVLADAFAIEGTVVVDVRADASGYGAQLEALRG